MTYSLENRRKTFNRLSSQLAAMGDRFLQGEGPRIASSWGRTESFEMDGDKVFVKRIPVTTLELESQFSTSNIYDLPDCFNYGIGSFGRSVFRELIANIKCTDWVLGGEWPLFPMTYHYRILPCVTSERSDDEASVQEYVTYWGGNENIARYQSDRRMASHELVLYQEHFPHDLDSWLRLNPHKTATNLETLFATIGFMRTKGMVHFDAHFQNVVTDGENPYLTDFGLVLDQEFSLSEKEVDFLDKHQDYDYARLISCLAFHLDDCYRKLPEAAQYNLKQKFGLSHEATTRQTVRGLASQVEHLAPDLMLDSAYCRVLADYRKCYELMHSFSAELIASPNKDVPFPFDRFRSLLSLAGVD